MERKLITILLVIVSVILVIGCVDRTGNIYKNKTDKTVTGTQIPIDGITPSEISNKHWTYEGEEGPDNWAKLGYTECKGKEQSPVDIPSKAPIHNTGISFNYKQSTLNITNNGHTIQVTYGNDSTLDVDNKTYKLLQFHFHAPSEHTINGSYSDMELHLVHKSDNDGEYAVIGVMLKPGTENIAYSQILKNLPKEKSEPQMINVDINAVNLLPVNKSYYRYNGSFTTPPCTEGVKWFVMNNPIKLSSSQIEMFKAIYDNNYRPIQPLNKRKFN